MTNTREEHNEQTWEAIGNLYSLLHYYIVRSKPYQLTFDDLSDREVRRRGYIVTGDIMEEFLRDSSNRGNHDWLLRNYSQDTILQMLTTYHLLKGLITPLPYIDKMKVVCLVELVTGIWLPSWLSMRRTYTIFYHMVKDREQLELIRDYIKSTDPLGWSIFSNSKNTRYKIKRAFRTYNKFASLIVEHEHKKEADTQKSYSNYATKFVKHFSMSDNNRERFEVLVNRYANSIKTCLPIVRTFRKIARNSSRIFTGAKEFREPLMPQLLDISDELFEENKHLLSSRYKRITYKGFVEEYFKNKGHVFKFDTGVKAPKLSTQLTKQKIPYTNKEIITITEFKEWLFLSLLSQGNTAEFAVREDLKDTPNFLVVDTKDFEIPYNVDRWAFACSCNHSKSEAGSHTHLMLKQLGVSYLKMYTYQEVALEGGKSQKVLAPYARTYFLRERGDIAHAGTYSNGDSLFTSEGIAKTAYETTTFILCVLFGKTVDEFEAISGIEIENDDYDTMEVDNWDTACVWSNMSDYCDYSKRGTGNILYNLDKTLVNWSKLQKDFVKNTLTACNQHACIKLNKGE